MMGRVTIDDELEDNINMKPFQTIPLYSGNMNDVLGHNTYRQMGTFKGLIRLKDPNQQNDDLDLDLSINDLLQPKQLYLRLYILRGINCSPRDYSGKSDPYLKIICGGQVYSTRSRYKKTNIKSRIL